MTLLLITQEDIIKRIFDLVCKKLDIDLIITDNSQIDTFYDIIIVDHYYIDDRFNLIKQYSKKLGAITNDILSFDKAKDFVINRPFLPNHLISILKELIDKITYEQKSEIKKEFINDFEAQNSISYLDSLVDDIASDIEVESDESIIQKPTIKQGGVLDGSELMRIKNLIGMDKETKEAIEELGEDDWLDLSDIIDKALEEVKGYEFKESYPIKLVLSKFAMDEIKPLLKKLNQEAINALTDGKEITLMLKLKE
ncbi:MAG: hypothetical protein GX118_02245 [Arcobacter butzleri]|nr:hypothetical protein [Aliarcobacter butzleri]